MASTETLPPPVLGEQGEPCRSCGAPLAEDQRYCLNCGQRRAGQRVDYQSLLGGAANASDASDAASPAPRRSSLAESPLAAVLGIAALGLMLLLGVLIGKGDSGGTSGQVPPPVVQVGGGSAADTASANAGGSTSQEVADTGAISSDWPPGKSGYTVELGALPKAGTAPADVEAQKKQAEDKGAPDVGALDSDKYASLPGGKYVIYSGVYDSKAEAQKALSKVKNSFPTATVVKVSTSAGSGSGSAGSGPTTNSVTDLTSQAARDATQPVQASDKALNDLNNKTGQAYEDAIKKLPDQISTQGDKAPLNPDKPTGGGSGTITIGN
jgi:SPOR domain